MSKLYTCTKCKKKKQYHEFVTRKRNKLGIEKTCKLCASEVKKDYYKRNAARVKAKVEEYKKNNPDKVKETQYNNYHNNLEKHREKRKAKYYTDKERYKAESLDYYYNNKERVLNTVRTYSRNNREKIAESNKRYYNLNKEKYTAHSAMRRARKKNAAPDWLTPEHKALIKSIYKAAKTLTKKSGIAHHVDHVIPLTHEKVCGLHVPWNLQVLTKYANLSKSNSFDEDMI